MPYDIIIGRSEEDKKKFGRDGTILLGKHYVKMGQTTSLSNEIFMDVAGSHVVFVCGKRGSGKSYSMGVMAEGMANLPDTIKNRISVIMLDTMGVYWTMKFANKKDDKLLDKWGLKAKGLDVKIYTPVGYFDKYKKEDIPTDFPFSINPAQLSPLDWCLTFGIEITSAVGVLIERIIMKLKKEKSHFSLDTIIQAIEADDKTAQEAKNAAISRYISAKEWGLFSEKATEIEEMAVGGQVTVIDLSCYAETPGAEGLRALAIGLISQHLFVTRMIARKKEEYGMIQKKVHYLIDEDETTEKKEDPLVWLVVDEAHEFLPKDAKTAASNALITILREGRQPGISLILATQQPGKIHSDVMTQSDIVLAHRVTARVDSEALGQLMQSYMREGLDKQLNYLPSVKGAGIIFDDTNERIYPMRVRPRFTWHGGSSPTALKEKEKTLEF